MQPTWDMVGRSEYPPLHVAMVAVGLEEVDTYVFPCQKTVARYITTRLILELFLAAELHPVAWL